jgi:OmpA-OmpF porin, OOP family
LPTAGAPVLGMRNKINLLLVSIWLLPVLPVWAQMHRSMATIKEAPKPAVASLEGTIVDAQTRQPVAGATLIAATEAGIVKAGQKVADNGAFKLLLPPTQPYQLTVTATGYEPYREALTFTSDRTDRLYGKTIALQRAEKKPAPTQQLTAQTRIEVLPELVPTVGATATLNAIRFVQSRPELLPESQPTLDLLLGFLKQNPRTRIELAGHTDNQGDFDQNITLSRERADAVRAFLVKNGIAARRIQTRGYGSTRPIATNSREETRQLNRRVEMTVLEQ